MKGIFIVDSSSEILDGDRVSSSEAVLQQSQRFGVGCLRRRSGSVSGQHEPRKAPRPGAPLSGVVLKKALPLAGVVLQNAHPRNEAVFLDILR